MVSLLFLLGNFDRNYILNQKQVKKKQRKSRRLQLPQYVSIELQIFWFQILQEKCGNQHFFSFTHLNDMYSLATIANV